MPNWCTNRVHISGSKEDVTSFMSLVRGNSEDENTFSFQTVLPCPSELHKYNAPQLDKDLEDRFIKEYGHADWYSWQVYNWGTKWEPSSSFLDYADEESAAWQFETAWSPPEGIYSELSNRFPELNISWFYDEPGMQIAGYLNNPSNS